MKRTRKQSKASSSSKGVNPYTHSQTTRANQSNTFLFNSAGDVGMPQTATHSKPLYNQSARKGSSFKFENLVAYSAPYSSERMSKFYFFCNSNEIIVFKRHRIQ